VQLWGMFPTNQELCPWQCRCNCFSADYVK
jgi:hypothetical protein